MANGAVNPGSNAKGTGTAGSSVGKNVGGRLPRRRLTKRAANATAIGCATTPPSPTPKMRPQALQSPVAAGGGDKPDGEFAASGSDEPKEHGGDIQSGELHSLSLIITIGMPEMREVSGICPVRLTGPLS